MRECRNPNHFGSWLKRIVVNRSIDEVRKKKIRIVPLDETLPVAADVEDFFGEDEIEQARLLENIKKGISLLPDGYRIVLVLKLIENYEYADISKALGLAESSVRSQFVRAKQKLLEIIRNFKNTENE
ncbi:MAG: sigma-70 family RNA polymerase sigma factor [Bacteroidales bacterium]|nr:sigma-70 family RNA polymerase sigma factor [Bacteroidales bacterium]